MNKIKNTSEKTMFANSRIFKIYFISYISILVIPILILGIIIQVFILPIVEKDIYATNAEKLEQSSIQLTNLLNNFKFIANSIRMNPVLTPYNMLNGSTYEGMRQLKIYQQSNSILSDIIYYVYGSKKIFCSNTSSTVDIFSKNIYPFKGINKSFYTDILPTISGEKTIPLELENGKKYCAVNFPINGSQSNFTLIFLIENSSIENIFRSTNSRFRENIILLNSDHTQLVATNPAAYLDKEFIEKITFNENNTIHQELIDNKYFISTLDLGENSYKLISITDKDSFMGIIIKIQIYFLIAMGVIFIFGVIVIFYLSRKNYKPIKNIITKITDNKLHKNQDEFKIINEAFDGLVITNQELNEKNQNYYDVLRDHIIKEAFLGNKIDDRRIKDLLSNNESISYFCILIWHNSSTTDHDAINKINIILEDKFSSFPAVLAMEDILKQHTFLLVAINDSNEDLAAIGEEIADHLYHDGNYKLAIGSKYNDIFLISKSYSDACNKLGIDKNNAANSIDLGYSYSKLDELEVSIKDGNAGSIHTILMDLFSSIAGKKLPAILLHYLILDIINIMIKLAIKHDIAFQDIREKISELLNFDNFNMGDASNINRQLVSTCIEISNCICENINRKNWLVEKTLKYIDENFNKQSFSIEGIAFEFNISQSYLSQFFKEKTGKTIINHIWTLRQAKAEELLVSTQLPIREIVERIGYIDASSFTRKFKASTGLSPCEYRIAHKGKS